MRKRVEDARQTVLDFSKSILEKAKRKLASYGNLVSVNISDIKNVNELDTILAYDKGSKGYFMLIKYHAGSPQPYYTWRKSNISGFSVLTGMEYTSIEAAMRGIKTEWSVDFYKVVS